MSIQSLVNELQSIRNELKTLRQKGMILRKKALGIEIEITKYLDAKEQPGLKYKGIAIVKEVKTTNRTKKKDEYKAELLRLADDYGIKDSDRDKFIDDINKSKKGSPQEKSSLKFKAYKNNTD
jgi:hypothetical protein